MCTDEFLISTQLILRKQFCTPSDGNLFSRSCNILAIINDVLERFCLMEPIHPDCCAVKKRDDAHVEIGEQFNVVRTSVPLHSCSH